METKFAVALLKGDVEKILAVFATKEEADRYGRSNKIAISEGLQYCFSSLFLGEIPQGDSMRIYDYYNLAQDIALA